MAETPITYEQIVGELYLELRMVKAQLSELAKERMADAAQAEPVDSAVDAD